MFTVWKEAESQNFGDGNPAELGWAGAGTQSGKKQIKGTMTLFVLLIEIFSKLLWSCTIIPPQMSYTYWNIVHIVHIFEREKPKTLRHNTLRLNPNINCTILKTGKGKIILGYNFWTYEFATSLEILCLCQILSSIFI